MRWLLRLQGLGSLVVLGAFALSELSARLLESFPGSALAWYVCVGIFRPFETARTGTSALRFLFGPASLTVACGLIVATGLVYVADRRWLLAAISNVSFVVAAFLACSWFGSSASVRSASLDGIGVGLPANSLVVSTMLIASFVAALLGHTMLLGVSQRTSGKAGIG